MKVTGGSELTHAHRTTGGRLRRLAFCGLLVAAAAGGFFVSRSKWHWTASAWAEARMKPAYWQGLYGSTFGDNRLATISIDVKFKHLQELERKRAEALDLGVLLTSDEDLVPAELGFDGRMIDARIRLKGDWVDHLRDDKWSFRIHTQGDEYLQGMRRLSLHHPRARNYLYEWAFLESARAEDLVAPRYDFVSLMFNGQDRGIYALEELFSEDTLEAHQRREGVIIKPDETQLWRDRARLRHPGRGFSDEGFIHATLDTFRTARVDRDPALSKQRDDAIGLLRAFQEGRRRPSDIFDVELMATYMALTELWQARHATAWHNMRFYYNPITARLEPTAFDGFPFARPPHGGLVWNDVDITIQRPNRLLDDPVLAAAYVRALRRVTSDAYLTQLRGRIGARLEDLYRALCVEFPSESSLELPWSKLEERTRFLQAALDSERMVIAYVIRSGDEVQVEVRSVMDLPVEVVGLQVGDGEADAPSNTSWEGAGAASGEGVLLPAVVRNAAPQYVRFKMVLPEHAERGSTVYVHTRMVGDDRVVQGAAIEQAALLIEERFADPMSVDQVVAAHPFLEQAADRELRIKPGDWQVKRDLVLPAEWRLGAGSGTRLRFAADAMLIAQGPLEFRGSADARVVLEPAGESWPGVAVLNAAESSVLEHVTVRGTREAQRGGWMLTGGVTFYRSDVLVVDSTFEDSRAEDALNIVRSQFELRRVRFRACLGNAFDGDFVSGSVRECHFEDTFGDGVLLSGSEVLVADSVFLRTGDMAVSAGERCRVRCERIAIDGSRYGVVSKDDSSVELDAAKISHARYGLAAFVKKPQFGPARISAANVTFTGAERGSLVQDGCEIRIDGVVQPVSPVDVRELYNPTFQTGVTGGIDLGVWLAAMGKTPASPAGRSMVFVGHVYPHNGYQSADKPFASDDGATMRDFVSHAQSLDPLRVVFGGDSAYMRDRGEFSHLASNVAGPLGDRARFVLGNHDVTGGTGSDEYQTLFPRPYWREDVDGVRLVYLNSAERMGMGEGLILGDEQLAFLRDALSGEGYRYALVFVHHALWMGDDAGRFANQEYRRVGRFWERRVLPLLLSGRVAGVFAGDGGVRVSSLMQSVRGVPHYLSGWPKDDIRKVPAECLRIDLQAGGVEVHRMVMHGGRVFELAIDELDATN